MAKNIRKKVKAKAKAKAHVKARRAKRVAKKATKPTRRKGDASTPRRTVTHEAVVTELSIAGHVNSAVGGVLVEAIAEPPATDSGLDPSEEKEILDALDEDARRGDDDELDEDPHPLD